MADSLDVSRSKGLIAILDALGAAPHIVRPNRGSGSLCMLNPL